MTTEDIYVRALSSRSLRPVVHRTTDIDVVIAAGVVAESLATTIYRLRAEFDAARADLLLRQTQQRDQYGQIKTNGLRGFTDVRQRLLNFVVQTARRELPHIDAVDCHRVTDQVLAMVLSPVCDRCHGVRFKVIHGTGRLSAQACDPPNAGGCGGTGVRPLRFPRSVSQEEIQVTRAVLVAIDRKMEHANKRIGSYLKQHTTERKK